MLRFFFFLLFSAKTAFALDGASYHKVRRALGQVESGNDPAARNRQTSASGKYQFMRAWDRFFLRHAGQSWTATVPPRKASKALRLKAHREQDRLFDVYYARIVRPWIQRVRLEGLGLGYTDWELVAIVHRQGERQAVSFLKRGYDPFDGRFGNRSLARHIERMREAMQEQLVAR